MGRMPDDMAARYGALLDEYDASIKLLNESKSETLTGLRAELKALGYQGAEIGAEVAMLKAAVKELGMSKVERQKADDKDEGVSDYVAILSLARARARTREADIPHDAETGEIIEPTPAAQIAAGLTEALAVVKGEAEPHRVHQIPGNGAGTAEVVEEVALDPAASAETIQEPVAVDPADPLRSGVADGNEADLPAPDANAPDAPAVAEGDRARSSSAPNPAVPLTQERGATGDRSAELPAAAPVAGNVVSIRTHNPDTHFLNANGLPRLHGCQNPDACAGSWRALCRGCGSPAEQGAVQ